MQKIKDEIINNIVKDAFPDKEMIGKERMVLALSSQAYRIDFKDSSSTIIKIGIDDEDIIDGKGLKEKTALELASKLLEPGEYPKVQRYYEEYSGLLGYVLFIEFLEGEVIDGKTFNKIASTDENINKICTMLQKLHSHKSSVFDTLERTSVGMTLGDYFKKTDKKIISAFKEDGLYEEFESKIKELQKVYKYFKDFTDYRLVHGDVNFKNVMVKDGRITSLIDWDRAKIAPIALEFANVKTLGECYGVSQWHKKLTDEYCNNFIEDGEKFKKEIDYLSFFLYFKNVRRKLTHASEAGKKIDLCVETGEDQKEHFLRKIKEYPEL